MRLLRSDPAKHRSEEPAETGRAAERAGARDARRLLRGALSALAALAVGLVGLGWFWSCEPPPLRPVAATTPQAPGVATVDALIGVASTLLDKHGGYLRNDVMPPGVLLDNMPSWEYGVLLQVRAFTRVLRNEISRPQSQSPPDPDLSVAGPRFNVDSTSWMLPADETAYGEGIARLRSYKERLQGRHGPEAFFQPRAKNLRLWLEIVSRRLGGMSQRLQAGAAPIRIEGSSGAEARQSLATSWWRVDDVFYEARGMAWALLGLTRGIEADFHDVLVDKNALATFHNLESTLASALRPMHSPVVLAGDGFGVLASHDLGMAAYLSSANNIVQTLETLMQYD